MKLVLSSEKPGYTGLFALGTYELQLLIDVNSIANEWVAGTIWATVSI